MSIKPVVINQIRLIYEIYVVIGIVNTYSTANLMFTRNCIFILFALWGLSELGVSIETLNDLGKFKLAIKMIKYSKLIIIFI